MSEPPKLDYQTPAPPITRQRVGAKAVAPGLVLLCLGVLISQVDSKPPEGLRLPPISEIVGFLFIIGGTGGMIGGAFRRPVLGIILTLIVLVPLALICMMTC